MNKLLTIIIGLLTLILCIYVIVYVLPFLFGSIDSATNKTRCKSRNRALEEIIAGRVANKFRDKSSHMWKTIEYSNRTGLHRSVIFMNDQSGAFDSLLPGDSIFKRVNSLELMVIRSGSAKKFQLNYQCNEKSA